MMETNSAEKEEIHMKKPPTRKVSIVCDGDAIDQKDVAYALAYQIAGGDLAAYYNRAKQKYLAELAEREVARA